MEHSEAPLQGGGEATSAPVEQMATAKAAKTDYMLLKHQKSDLERARANDLEWLQLLALLDGALALDDFDLYEALGKQLDDEWAFSLELGSTNRS